MRERAFNFEGLGMKGLLSIVFIFSFLVSTNVFANQYASAKVVGDNIGARGTSTALDSHGNQGICYHDGDTNSLNYAYHNGQAWVTEIANDGNSVGHFCAILFDDDVPHIVHYDLTDQDLKHSRKVGNAWNTVIIDAQVSIDTDFGLRIENYHRLSIAINNEDVLGTAYYDATDDDLIYAEWDGVDWALEEVESEGDVGKYASLAYDADGNPGIAYQKDVAGAGSHLMYVYHNGDQWLDAETVDDNESAGNYISLGFDSNSIPHVAYQYIDAGNFNYLKYTNRLNDAWNASATLDSGPRTGRFCQMTISPMNTAHIIYRDYFRSALFPDVNYVKLINLYFIDKIIPARVHSREDRVNFSSLNLRDYEGLSVASDENDNLVFVFAKENLNDFNNSLYAGELTSWRAQIRLLTPNNNNNQAQDDEFTLRWTSFKLEQNAEIRFFYWDAGFNSIQIGDTVEASDGNSYILETSDLDPGEYTITMRSSTNGFQTFNSSRARTALTVPERPVQENQDNQVADNAQDPVVPVKNRPPSRPRPVNLDGDAEEEEADSGEDADSDEDKVVFRINNSEDEDGDKITYTIQICADENCDEALYVIEDVKEGEDGQTLVEVLVKDLEKGGYYWRVKAVDENDESSEWSTPIKFSVGESDDATSTEGTGDTETSNAATASSGCSLVSFVGDGGRVSLGNVFFMGIFLLPILLVIIVRKKTTLLLVR